MTRTVIIGGVAAAAILGAWWAFARDPPAPADAARDPGRRELAMLRSELDELRVRSLHSGQMAASAAGTSAPVEDRTTPDAPAGSAAPPRATPRAPTPVEHAAQLDGTFAAEDPDPAWSRDAEHRIGDALASTMPAGTTVGRVECRASLCRVESFHTSRDAFRSFVDASLLGRDRKIWNAAFTSFVLDASDSGVKAVSFVAREGHTIPSGQWVDG